MRPPLGRGLVAAQNTFMKGHYGIKIHVHNSTKGRDKLRGQSVMKLIETKHMYEKELRLWKTHRETCIPRC
jgi:hypothetical protein